jgi:catechol 2,3-dioxygenase-like lactoylglutathione lyase family enzyme
MARYLHTMVRITDFQRSRAFHEALGMEFRRDLDIVCDGEREATNYFFGFPVDAGCRLYRPRGSDLHREHSRDIRAHRLFDRGLLRRAGRTGGVGKSTMSANRRRRARR